MTAYRVFIHLGANDWGNERMRQLADEYAWQHPEHRPLVVKVYEHAGWHLSYLYGAPSIAAGTICGTANDGASLAPAVVEFGKSIGNLFDLPEVRR